MAEKNRLRKNKEFDEVFKKGRGFKKDFLILKFIGKSSGENRIGFIVSKKVSNKAVVRNKVKRRLRDLARKKMLAGRADIVLIALPGIGLKTFPEVEKNLEDLLLKAKMQ